MSKIFIFNGAGRSENYHFETDGTPYRCDGRGPFKQRFLVRELPSSENVPCGRVVLPLRTGQEYVTPERLERLYEEQERNRY
ncbi:hypothetical protein [Methylosinus sp. PW1]|uniref:hypothetical protein n=1 Tax=Methylosinus sp. PW1 TaxID=107636 RepID=UPI000563848C|nr:hypothetical protein [Methylosinus sp. PW1]